MTRLKNAITFCRLVCLFGLFHGLVLLPGCKKEEQPEIKILNLKSITDIYERDTLSVQYYVARENLDSVCLVIDGKIRKTQGPAESNITFIPESRGSYAFQLRLYAYYRSGVIIISQEYFVNVITLYTPALDFMISRDDGLPSFFIGERISITIKTRSASESLDAFSRISVYLNDDLLGSKTEGPYSFISDTIQREQNKLTVRLTDKNNRVHYVENNLIIQANKPPSVTFEFNYRHNMPPGYYFTSDSIVTLLYGTDDVKICRVDYYVDYKFVTKKQFDTDRIFFNPFPVGKMPAGRHSVYCIVYDDRGKQTKSAILAIQVYKDIDLNKAIRDVEYTDDPQIVFLLSGTSLYVLNPVPEEITRIVELPVADAVAMDYSVAAGKLYIAATQGRLFSYNVGSGILEEVPLAGVSNITDMEIDNYQNLALISNNKLISVNLSTGKLINTSTALSQGSTLIFDKTNKFIITGGNPGLSSSNVYIYQLGSDTLIYRKKADIGGYGYRLEMSPKGTEFIISPKSRDLRTMLNSYRTSDLSKKSTYQQQYASTSTYSADGNFLFITDNWNSVVNIYNTGDMLKTGEFHIPIADNNYLNYLLPNKDNTSLVVMTMDVFSSKVKIVFVRL